MAVTWEVIGLRAFLRTRHLTDFVKYRQISRQEKRIMCEKVIFREVEGTKMEKSGVALIISGLAFLWTIFWSIFNHRNQKREKQAEKHERDERSRERVQAQLSLSADGNGPAFHVK